MGRILLPVEFNDDEIMKAAEEIKEAADNLKDKTYKFNMLLKARVVDKKENTSTDGTAEV